MLKTKWMRIVASAWGLAVASHSALFRAWVLGRNPSRGFAPGYSIPAFQAVRQSSEEVNFTRSQQTNTLDCELCKSGAAPELTFCGRFALTGVVEVSFSHLKVPVRPDWSISAWPITFRPATPSQCAFLTLDTRTPYRADWTGADAGKIAHYLLRWVSTRGEKGPWSETVSATIGA